MFGFKQAAEREELSQNLLRSAVFQIKFPTVKEVIIQKEYLQKTLEDRFTNVKNMLDQQVNFISDLKTGTPILESTSSNNSGFEFRSADNNRVLSVTRDTLTLTVFGKIYTTADDIFDEFNEVYLPILNHFKVSKLSRVAIRKINLLEVQATLNNTDQDSRNFLHAIFNNALIGNVENMPRESILERGVTYIDLTSKEGHKLKMGYGLLEDEKNKHNIKQILLDLDIFQISRETDIDCLVDEFDKINSEMYNIFTWAINPSLISTLNKHNPANS